MHLDLLNLLAVLLTAWTAGRLMARVGYPPVLGELLAGIVVGPALLGWVHIDPALSVLAEVGILLMMLYIGMEIDPRELKRASWAGVLAAAGGFIAPFVLTTLLVRAFGGAWMASIFVGIAAGVTSLATKSRILVDLKLMDTRIAHVMMSAALVADGVSLVAFAAIVGTGDGAPSAADAQGILLVVLKALAFIAVVAVLVRSIVPRITPYLVDQGFIGRTSLFTVVLILAVGFAELAELAGLHGVLGTFVAGMFLRDRVLGRVRATDLRAVVHDASIGFLAPIFFVTAGFEVSFDVVRTDGLLLVLVVIVATAAKIFGTMLAYLPTGRSWREGLVIGCGTNGRGAVDIIMAGLGLQAGVIDQRLFSIIVVMAIVTTATVPALLAWGVRWLEGRGEVVRVSDHRRGVVIVGAGRVACTLAQTLKAFRPVAIVDANPHRCEEARAQGLDAICGDALDPAVLRLAGTDEAGIVVAMTPNATVNVLVTGLAQSEYSVPDVYVLARYASRGTESALRHLRANHLFDRPISLDTWETRLALNDSDVVTLPASHFDSDPHADGEQAPPELALAIWRDDDVYPFSASVRSDGDEEVLALRIVDQERHAPRDRPARTA